YLFVNRQYEKLANIVSKEVIGKSDYDIFTKPVADLFRSQDKEVKKGKSPVDFTETIPLADGEHTFITSKFPLINSAGHVFAVGGVCTDITERKRMEEKLEKESRRLNEVNIALKVLLKESSQTKDDLEDNMKLNIKSLLLPYIAELESSPLNKKQQFFINIIKTNIDEITSSFSRKLTIEYNELTPREIQIANLIRQGRANKEIARLLNISFSAVDFHRRNLRSKMNIKGKKINLRSHLLSCVG
ncbi:MAG: helix-turn-helix transcriptional regulator, partial [Deltaproteobacteria bacterium]|nr:helix-turn-helix transcriptional regulator [Deltaproteobacteria bacterium]